MNNRITTHPNVMAGKPVIAGTRITVELLLRQLAQGITAWEICAQYPQVTEKDIHAAIAYAARLVAEEAVYPLDRPRIYAHAKATAR